MSDTLFKTPQEVLGELFGLGSQSKQSNTVYFINIVFILSLLCIFVFIFRGDIKNILSILGSSLYINDSIKRQLLFDCIKNNIGIILGPIFLIAILYYAIRDPKALTNNTSSYVLVISVIILVSFGLYSNLLNFSKTPYMPFLIGGITLVIISAIGYFSSYITPSTILIVGNFMRILVLLLIVVGLAIAYKLFSERIKSLTGWSGFFANFLFYIPCMLSDGLEYLLQQYHITPNIVFVLLIIELLLILGYVYIPKIIRQSIKKTALVLQNKPVYLDKETNVGNIENFIFKPLGDKMLYLENKENYRRNYCLNMWVFLNIQPSSNSAYANETTIFNYNNHPRITHKNSSDNKRLKNRNIYTFYFSNTQYTKTGTEPDEESNKKIIADTNNNAKYEVSIPDQKWNMLSFNYFESKVDLYINGNLERTFYFTNNIPDYLPTDSIVLGSDGGVAGAICNVTYNKIPLTSEQIATLYNTNFLSNPPVDIIE